MPSEFSVRSPDDINQAESIANLKLFQQNPEQYQLRLVKKEGKIQLQAKEKGFKTWLDKLVNRQAYQVPKILDVVTHVNYDVGIERNRLNAAFQHHVKRHNENHRENPIENSVISVSLAHFNPPPSEAQIRKLVDLISKRLLDNWEGYDAEDKEGMFRQAGDKKKVDAAYERLRELDEAEWENAIKTMDLLTHDLITLIKKLAKITPQGATIPLERAGLEEHCPHLTGLLNKIVEEAGTTFMTEKNLLIAFPLHAPK